MGEVVETGKVVEEFLQGNVKIRILDSAYVGKTQQDIEKILDRIADIAWDAASCQET